MDKERKRNHVQGSGNREAARLSTPDLMARGMVKWKPASWFWVLACVVDMVAAYSHTKDGAE